MQNNNLLRYDNQRSLARYLCELRRAVIEAYVYLRFSLPAKGKPSAFVVHHIWITTT